jgi:hypothetical protein
VKLESTGIHGSAGASPSQKPVSSQPLTSHPPTDTGSVVRGAAWDSDATGRRIQFR